MRACVVGEVFVVLAGRPRGGHRVLNAIDVFPRTCIASLGAIIKRSV